MSRLGKLPITLPVGTQARLENGFVVIAGPKGELKEKLPAAVTVTIDGSQVGVKVAHPDEKRERSLWGLYRTLIANMVAGVNRGFEKKLEINGVGYRVQAAGRKLVFAIGFSHPVYFPLPDGINADIQANIITISGNDKHLVGETAAQIRQLKPPEPYKGKGIKYIDEIIRRKAGKAAGKAEK